MQLKTESNIDIENSLKNYKNLIDSHINKILNNDSIFSEPKTLWDAVKYSILNGGKRIRGTLCLAVYESISQRFNTKPDNMEDCLTVAVSIELIHAMSLIHDDLPCMDDDDLRRGKPSCHKVFGEATAILAGDAMLSLAYELIVNDTKNISNSQQIKLVKLLTNAFTFGLVPGQILDLLTLETSTQSDLSRIEKISKLKTAELIKSSITSGAIIAITKEIESIVNKPLLFENLNQFGLNLGLAFQIIDDILDVTSDTKTLGKTSGKDAKQKKTTYPLVIGIEKSKTIAKDMIQKAKSALEIANIKSHFLDSLADYVINRIS